MIGSLISLPTAERRLLPGGNLKGPTPYVIAIMTFAITIIAAAGLALSNAAGLVAEAVEHRFVVQVPDGRGNKTEHALRTLRVTQGVASARPVPEAEMRRTLERWLGPGGLSAELPVPALIHVDLVPGADVAAVSRKAEAAAPGARFVSERTTLQPLLRSLRALQWLALALVVLIGAATSAAVVLAARGALDTHRSTIEIMHGIGATDDQIATLFQRKIALDALAGGLVGGAAAATVLLLLGGGAASLAGDLAGRQPLGGRDLLILSLIPVAAVVLATLVARVAVIRALRAAP